MLSRRHNTFSKLNYNSHRTNYYNQRFPDLVPCKCCFICVLFIKYGFICPVHLVHIQEKHHYFHFIFSMVFFSHSFKKIYIPTYFKSKQETFPSFVPYLAGTGELQYGIFTFSFSCKEMNYVFCQGVYIASSPTCTLKAHQASKVQLFFSLKAHSANNCLSYLAIINCREDFKKHIFQFSWKNKEEGTI